MIPFQFGERQTMQFIQWPFLQFDSKAIREIDFDKISFIITIIFYNFLLRGKLATLPTRIYGSPPSDATESPDLPDIIGSTSSISQTLSPQPQNVVPMGSLKQDLPPGAALQIFSDILI